MVSIGDAIAEQASLPSDALETLRTLRCEWNTGQPDPSVLVEANIRIWRQLKAKHGNSTTIVDAADRALRALLCLAYPRNDDFRSDTIGWAAEMLSTEPWPRATRFF